MSNLHGKSQKIRLVAQWGEQSRGEIVVLPMMTEKETIAGRTAEPLQTGRGVAVESLTDLASVG